MTEQETIQINNIKTDVGCVSIRHDGKWLMMNDYHMLAWSRSWDLSAVFDRDTALDMIFGDTLDGLIFTDGAPVSTQNIASQIEVVPIQLGHPMTAKEYRGEMTAAIRARALEKLSDLEREVLGV